MIAILIRRALAQPMLVLLTVALVAVAGVVAFRRSKIEAYPDISGVSVQVITSYPGRAPEEVERQISIPIERAMGTVPRAETIRSRTIFGLSVVQVSFEEGTESYWARQRVQEALTTVDLPKIANAGLGPMISSAGEIVRYELRGDGTKSLMELRTLQDWVVIPRLQRVAGVGDVGNFGGDVKQFAVMLRPERLQRYSVTLNDITDALKSNNNTAGGSVLKQGSMSFVVRGRGALEDEAEIGRIFVKTYGGTPVRISDIAEVRIEPKTPIGIFGRDDRDRSLEGIVVTRKGENASVVLEGVKKAIEELNARLEPEGGHIDIFYDRSVLVDATFDTVAESVAIGVGLVGVVLVFFLGNPRLAAIVAMTIPFSLLFALTLMYCVDIPLGLLSIGAIDFGIIVDGAVIVADHLAQHLGKLPRDADRKTIRHAILEAVLEVQRPVFFAVVMIIGVHLPLLTLVRIEGLLFRPMAITIVFALLGCLMFALTAVPVLTYICFPHGMREWENPLLKILKPLYRGIVMEMVAHRRVTTMMTFIGVGLAGAYVLPRLGTEFLPNMDEGTIAVRANFPEGMAMEQTALYADRIRAIAREFTDVQYVTSQAGRCDNGTDPFPPSRLEMQIGPKPREEWTQFRTKAELVAALGKRFRDEFPTVRFNFTQPIIDSVTEDSNGTSANLAVELAGTDPQALLDNAQKTLTLLKAIPGAQDVAIEQEGPQPQLLVAPNRDKCSRYNVRIEDVATVINTALGGEPIGTLYEAERAFEIVAKFDPQLLKSPAAIGRLPVFTADGTPIPLASVADITVPDGQTLIAREGGRRRITVRCDIVGRDQGGFVAEAQERFAQEINVPDGVKVSWIGMFENLERARKHFMVVGPITVAVLFGLLLVTLGSFRGAMVVMLALPGAFLGGAFAIHTRGMNVNVSVGVGFAALFGVSIMNGVLMVQRITTHRLSGLDPETAIREAIGDLLRPIVMASLVAMLGLLPASMATGLGSDVQRPLATVIVWGLFGSTALTLFFVPVMYRLLLPSLPQPRTADDDI